jgi:hypothetical protein
MQAPQKESPLDMQTDGPQQSDCDRQVLSSTVVGSTQAWCSGEQTRHPSMRAQNPSSHSISEPQLVTRRQSLTQSTPSGPGT